MWAGFFSPLETGGAVLCENLQKFDWYYMEEKEEFQIAMRFVPTTGSVLEVGSGKAAFATKVGVDRYTGLEFNDKAIEGRMKKIQLSLRNQLRACKEASEGVRHCGFLSGLGTCCFAI